MSRAQDQLLHIYLIRKEDIYPPRKLGQHHDFFTYRNFKDLLHNLSEEESLVLYWPQILTLTCFCHDKMATIISQMHYDFIA